MARCIAWLLSAATVSALLLSCSKKAEDTPEAAAPAGPPAVVMAEIAAWKAIGGVTDLSDLAPKSAAPGTPNAADLHRPLIDILKGMSMNEVELVGDPWESPANSLKYVVETYERELATIKQAVAMPYCDWGTPFEEGVDALMPHLSYSRSAARLLMVDARMHHEAGDYGGAAESIHDIFLLADQIRLEPLAISMLVAGSLDAMAAEGIKNFLKEEPTVPTALREAIERRRPRADLRRALLAEGVVVISTHVQLAGGAPTTPVAEQPMSDAVADGLVWNLRMFRHFIDQSDVPYYQNTASADTPPIPSGAAMSDLQMDAEMLGRLCSVTASFENNLSLARTALELQEYRLKHGNYPDPATYRLPEDVFTGEPIDCVFDSSGFTLRASRTSLGGERDIEVWKW